MILAGGDNEGVVPGSILDVVRAGEVIAKLRVTAVEAGRSAADIVMILCPLIQCFGPGMR